MRILTPAAAAARVLAPVLGLMPIATASAGPADSLVLSAAGNLPFILTAPHGGMRSIPGVTVRRNGNTLTDAGTLELTEAVAQRVGAALAGKPYVVAALFSRKYIDANRAEAEAIESLAAKPYYQAYHRQVRTFVNDVRAKFPRGALLLDIHGQAQDPDMLHRGTRNGATVATLIQRHGQEAVTGRMSVLGFLAARGYQVFPSGPQMANPAEDRRFSGGYTVATYGSNHADGIDAIQIELGKTIRANPALADDLAAAIVVFARRYLLARSAR